MKKTKELTNIEKNEIVYQNFDNLISSAKRLQKPESYKKVKRAFDFAHAAHEGQFRKTGQKLPFIVHPIAVAEIMATEMGFGSTTISAALLHDVVEDTDYTVEDIEKYFGKEIAVIVDGVTKITDHKSADAERQAQPLVYRKLVLKMNIDKRTAYVKIADRLHNLRTLSGIKENSQMIKTAESLAVYAPLALQLGLFKIKKEIEDLSFKYRHKEEYEVIKDYVEKSKKDREELLKNSLSGFLKSLKSKGTKFEIIPKIKSYYRIWRTMSDKHIDFADIHNLMSIRLVFEANNKMLTEKEQAYLVYSHLTDYFITQDSQLKDWISTPKSNGFEALISNIMLNGEWVEFQILTNRMNQISERGYARGHDNKHLENVKEWVNSRSKALENENLTNEEILDIIRPQDREINVFTPQGEMLSFPKGATSLDFAFRIHSDLGFHFVAATINNKMVGFDYKLRRNDRVKIHISKTQTPDEEWLDTIFCPRNKSEIEKYFKKQNRQKIDIGEVKFNTLKDECLTNLSKIISHFHCENKDALFLRLGTGTITLENISQYINYHNSSFARFKRWFDNSKTDTENEQTHNFEKLNPHIPFTITSVDNISLATCCRPMPGDPSIVYQTRSSKYIVHRKDCINSEILNATEGKSTAVVNWFLDKKEDFKVKIRFTGIDRKGLLADILHVISDEMEINMLSLVIRTQKNIFRGVIELLVTNAQHLELVIKAINRVDNIDRIYRVTYT